MCFLFNRTTLQVFVTYFTGALYVHPLWFYKLLHDNRVRFKLFVACQRWWFQWRFWFVPSVPGYLREEEEHKPDPWRNPIERNHMGLHLENEVASVKTLTIISNNSVFGSLLFDYWSYLILSECSIYRYTFMYSYSCTCTTWHPPRCIPLDKPCSPLYGLMIVSELMIVEWINNSKKKQLQETVHSTLLLGCFYFLYML